MAKIRFFFLQLLFFGAPLIYTWLYIPFVNIDLSSLFQFVPIWSGFESVKVIFLFFCVLAASVFHLLILFQKKKPWNIPMLFFTSIVIFFLWTVIALFINQSINPYFAFGNFEKHHGWFFYAALFVLFFLLRQNSSSEHRRLFMMSFLGCVGVMLYAIFQKLWLDPLQDFYETRLDTHRIFSTLGNPNYLAWLVLMILPLMHETVFAHKGEHKALWDVLLWIVGGLLIYSTGSYLAWICFALYVFIVLMNHVIAYSRHRYAFWSVFIVSILGGISFLWYHYSEDILALQKMQGFIARFYLWKTGFAALTHDVWHFLFWYGPDGFLPVSEHFRHPLLSVYEDPAYRIDRSHNVILDFALHFGVVTLGIILFFAARVLKYLSVGKQISLLFFVLYFSFNIPVLVHFLLVLQIFASFERKRIIRR
jgi:hypothetical protein